MSRIELNIANYLSIKDFKKALSLEHLKEVDKMVETLVLLTDQPKEEIIKWKPAQLQQVYEKVSQKLVDIEPQFYPIMEIEGVKYGFNPITNMTLAEYVDLETLTQDPQNNMAQIMAIFYRPITKHRFNGFTWSAKLGYKKIDGLAEELFKYYEVEEYDSSTRNERAEIFENLPMAFSLGATTFFLTLVNNSLLSMNLYSEMKNKKRAMEMIKKQIKMISPSIGPGLAQFITYQRLPSYPSMEMIAL